MLLGNSLLYVVIEICADVSPAMKMDRTDEDDKKVKIILSSYKNFMIMINFQDG